ncbi:MIP/aquaporin family protein [Alkalibacterium pelagium]|uniref:Glycerol uptake facilitator protein n=1 Tax=Alkalibacterium pelagium TaxID=426702 RepID=A0A1H7LK55_9LACT|nr:MIP/aquaporin family protein [Alkalibacterium pelagium]GEN50856.1 glycerol uptake facilitator protein [Alkalibacterium pelagium]SEK99324.1 glycerol uptake facilitator protein [Alkalibacterium pelagium]
METTLFQQLLGEYFGTMILILLGDGVVAANVLKKTKSYDSGWIMIGIGWGLAVAMAVYAVGWLSPAHINPAVTLGMAVAGEIGWGMVIPYSIAQIAGGFTGAVIVWLHYIPHFRETDDQASILAVFSTGPAIKGTKWNLLSEAIATFVLVFGLLAFTQGDFTDGLNPLIVGLLIVAIGLSLGGTTGYAINPARDLGPRIAHQILPIANKGSSDWEYSWIPIIGPFIGGAVGALVFLAMTF